MATTNLTTRFVIDDGVNPPLEIFWSELVEP
jgi:hypothetical protein